MGVGFYKGEGLAFWDAGLRRAVCIWALGSRSFLLVQRFVCLEETRACVGY